MAFDLDGTLLRGPTVCELLAAPLGRSEDMRRFETLTTEADIAAARVEMARWYDGRDRDELLSSLHDATWARGAAEAVSLLQERRIEVVIASITWSFAVEWFARRLAIRHYLGTGLRPGGGIDHVWGRDKAAWAIDLARALDLPAARLAAVGDSATDADLLRTAAIRVFVGKTPPEEISPAVHLPDADLRDVAWWVLDAWEP